MALCIWQIHRALGGNSLSWAYVFEWPLFAAYAVYMWWRILHEKPDAAGRAARRRTASPRRAHTGRRGQEAPEDAELTAYNEYLARLAERDRAAGR